MSDDKWKALAAPFTAADIEWRIGRAGKGNNGLWAMCLAYVTNRAIMQRLDDVLGPPNWRNQYAPAPVGNGLLCGLSVRVGDEWVTKWDGADPTAVEPTKGGLSDSMKRSAVQWGIGRYLYHLEEGWAECFTDLRAGRFRGKLPKDDGGDRFSWNPPMLPEWALPEGEKPSHNQPPPRRPDPAPAQPSTKPEDGAVPVVGTYPFAVANVKSAKKDTLWVVTVRVTDGPFKGREVEPLFLSRKEGKGLNYSVAKASAMLKRKLSVDDYFALQATDLAGAEAWANFVNKEFPVDKVFAEEPNADADFDDVDF